MQFIHTLGFKRASAVGIYVIIILGSSVPGKEIPKFFQLTPDKLIHGLEYFTLGAFVGRWAAAEFAFGIMRKAGLILFICGLCGMLDEFYQHLTPNRSPDFYDWCLDFTGALLSTVLLKFWERPKH